MAYPLNSVDSEGELASAFKPLYETLMLTDPGLCS